MCLLEHGHGLHKKMSVTILSCVGYWPLGYSDKRSAFSIAFSSILCSNQGWQAYCIGMCAQESVSARMLLIRSTQMHIFDFDVHCVQNVGIAYFGLNCTYKDTVVCVENTDVFTVSS